MVSRWDPDWADREFAFICLASRGGKYSDVDFAAGHFIGGLVEKLRVASVSGTVPVDVAVPVDLIPQVDLIAMKFGYVVTEKWHEQYYNYIPISFAFVRDYEEGIDESEGDSREEPGSGYE